MAKIGNDALSSYSTSCTCGLTSCICWGPTTSTITYPYYVIDPIVLQKLAEIEAKLDHLLELFMEL